MTPKTITEAPVLDAQECFNRVARHIFEQGEQAYVSDTECASFGTCMYRQEKKGRMLKCAIGALIPDSLYKPGMENKRAANLIQGHPEVLELFEGIQVTPLGVWEEEGAGVLGHFLNNLQTCHDNTSHWQSTLTMKEALAKVAADYKLDSSVLNKLSFEDR